MTQNCKESLWSVLLHKIISFIPQSVQTKKHGVSAVAAKNDKSLVVTAKTLAVWSKIYLHDRYRQDVDLGLESALQTMKGCMSQHL